MQFSEDDVRRLERLAALRLADAERSRMFGQLARILAYVRQLQELDVSAVPPTVHVIESRHLPRADEARSSLPSGEMLRNAPDARGGFYRVPRFVFGRGGSAGAEAADTGEGAGGGSRGGEDGRRADGPRGLCDRRGEEP
jgi:aspartyl-tRNA(Asn)/glutamyl-tRNA(Gln) amidotransferase subunit C